MKALPNETVRKAFVPLLSKRDPSGQSFQCRVGYLVVQRFWAIRQTGPGGLKKAPSGYGRDSFPSAGDRRGPDAHDTTGLLTGTGGQQDMYRPRIKPATRKNAGPSGLEGSAFGGGPVGPEPLELRRSRVEALLHDR